MNDRGPEGIFEKLHLMGAEFGPIGKEGTNTFQGFKFRSVEQVKEALQPLLAKHGVVMLVQFGQLQMHNIEKGMAASVHVQLGFIDKESGTNAFHSCYGYAADSSDKCVGKAQTAAFKQAVSLGFCIREKDVEDQDLDSPAVNRKVAKPAAAPKNLLEE